MYYTFVKIGIERLRTEVKKIVCPSTRFALRREIIFCNVCWRQTNKI